MIGANNILLSEFEALLLEVASDEADAASLYIEEPNVYGGKPHEEMAGVPGGGTVLLIGPVLLPWLAAIVSHFLVEFQKHGINSVAKATVTWISGRFKSRQITSREETLTKIFKSLVELGFRADEAGEIAERVWARGESAAQQLKAKF